MTNTEPTTRPQAMTLEDLRGNPDLLKALDSIPRNTGFGLRDDQIERMAAITDDSSSQGARASQSLGSHSFSPEGLRAFVRAVEYSQMILQALEANKVAAPVPPADGTS